VKQYEVSQAIVVLPFVILCAILLGCGSDTLPTTPTSGPQVVLSSMIQIDPLDTTHVDRLPFFKSLVLPEYPPLARQAGLSGRVWVRVYVDQSGTALDAQVYQSSTIPSFDEAVVRSANECRYFAAQCNGTYVAVRVIYAVDFILQ
jgi:TonB family protein